MVHYVGLDVSLKSTAICVVDQAGKVVCEGVVISDPEAIAEFIKSHASNVERIGLETGPTATWLWTELNKLGLPVICIDARHAKAALKMQINKTDRNDAAGIARIMQCGWYREVRVKDLTRSRLYSSAELCSLKSSEILRTRSAGCSRISGSSSDGKDERLFPARHAADRGPAGTRRCGRAATQVTRGYRAAG